MIVREYYCPECGMLVDAPTDKELMEADKVIDVELNSDCGCVEDD